MCFSFVRQHFLSFLSLPCFNDLLSSLSPSLHCFSVQTVRTEKKKRRKKGASLGRVTSLALPGYLLVLSSCFLVFLPRRARRPSDAGMLRGGSLSPLSFQKARFLEPLPRFLFVSLTTRGWLLSRPVRRVRERIAEKSCCSRRVVHLCGGSLDSRLAPSH